MQTRRRENAASRLPTSTCERAIILYRHTMVTVRLWYQRYLVLQALTAGLFGGGSNFISAPHQQNATARAAALPPLQPELDHRLLQDIP